MRRAAPAPAMRAAHQQDPRSRAPVNRQSVYQEPYRQEPYRGRQPQAQRAAYQHTARTMYQEDIAPGTVVESQTGQGPMTSGPVTEQWMDGGPFEYGDGGYGGECYDGCCDDCCGCGPVPGFWGRAEYLYWWVRGAETPPLVTTSPDGTPPLQAGVLPDATILFGNERVNTSGRSGARFTLGYWFNSCDLTGIETSFFYLGKVNQQYFNDSSDILARPFINVNTGDQDSHLITYPDIIDGSINVSANSRVYGGDVNLRRSLVADCWKRIDVLAGYRYFRIAEGLSVTSDSTVIDEGGQPPTGTTFNVFDSFNTRNDFNGGQLGVNAQMMNGCWTLDLLAKLAIGGVSQYVTIDGRTITTLPDGQQTDRSGGILALPSNSGPHNRSVFSVLPEFSADLRYQITPLWKLNLGYTLMFVTNVARPGDQINLNIDPDQFPPNQGGTQPTFSFVDSDVWLQGISFGVECNF
ncbi:MAG: BBP7 family outer membrane beta-barrel protein [Pirellulales bacterium]